MTSLVEATAAPQRRAVRPRRYLICPPRYFDVTYAINPWMDPGHPVSPQRALEQWTVLRETYRRLGHQVDELEPRPGLPDMVFAANGATVIDGFVLAARFARAERGAEADWHAAWHRRHGGDYAQRELRPGHAVNEAEGDFAVLTAPDGGTRVLAGYGFRTTIEAHAELRQLTGAEVISLELVDPRFYHLDVALTVLDDERGLIAYYPGAFSLLAQAELARSYPGAVIATEADALAFGLNCVSDGRHVVIQTGADELSARLRSLGFEPVPVDLSELILAGGSVKCCTQEIRPAVPGPNMRS